MRIERVRGVCQFFRRVVIIVDPAFWMPGQEWAMDRLSALDKDELIRRMRTEFERTMAEVARAVNEAPDGHLIDGSEERCRDVLGEFRRLAYEAAVQMRVEATEADPAFSPGGAPRAPRPGDPDGADVLRTGAGVPASLRHAGRRDRGPGRRPGGLRA